MLQLPSSGVRRLGYAVLLAGASCSAPDPSGLFGPANAAPIRSEAPNPDATVDPAAGDTAAGAADPSMSADADGVLPSASNGEGAPISAGLEPPESTGGDGGSEPVALPADAGVPIAEPADAGAPPSEPEPEPTEPEPTEPEPTEPEPTEPEPEPECSGVSAEGSCWYVGALNQSCNEVCATRGGFDPASLAIVGTPAQGGSIEGCDAVLQALGAPAGVVNEGFREDELGFGCHVFIDPDGTASAWWLTAPDVTPAVADPSVQLLCGCAR